MIPPLRTAATTAALRRTTHLLVLGRGSCSISRVAPSDSPRGVFIRRRQATLGPAPHLQDPPETELVGNTAACSRAHCSTGPMFRRRGNSVPFTIFSRSRAFCHQFFRLFEAGASVHDSQYLKARKVRRSGSDLLCKPYAETEALGGQIPVSRFFHDHGPSFFTFGSCVQREFHPRLTRAILPLFSQGGTR